MESGIYCIRNTKNGKVYIGSSTNIKTRMSRHASELKYNSHTNNFLQNDWDEYGSTSFTFETIEECDKDVLKERERFYISQYNAVNEGYNVMNLGIIIKKNSRERIKMVAWRLKESTINNIKELAFESRMGINEFVQELLDKVLKDIDIE